MSFGFSAGDFIAAAILIKEIIAALSTSSTTEYRELIIELHGLKRALDEIERLRCPPSQMASLNAVKVAALLCQHPLDEFAAKLKTFEGLDANARTNGSHRTHIWRMKLQWGFTMEEEVQKLRAYLVAHVGSLNMRLNTLNLKASWSLSQELAEQQGTLRRHVNDSQKKISDLSQEIGSQTLFLRKNASWMQRLTNLVNGCMVTQIAVLVDLVGKIWTVNMQIMDILIRQQSDIVAPDTKHTWFQQPVRFEDALGRVLPVPSEYNWGKIDAIILDQFKTGPGREKVLCGEYELFNTIDSRQKVSSSELEALVPGMSITMAFVIGLYEHQPLKECPRPGCRTREFQTLTTGGRRCSTCNVWFDISRTKLPRPFRFPPVENVFKDIRNERKWFTNVRLFPSELPSLPLITDDLGHFGKAGAKHGTMPYPSTRGNSAHSIVPQTLTVLSPLYVEVDVPKGIATEAITAIASIFGVSVDELREISASAPGIDSLGLDSLTSIEIVHKITSLGVKVPAGAYGTILIQEGLEVFLEGFIAENGKVFDEK